MTNKANPFLRAALAYAAELHWPVFPLRPRTKEPATPHGFQDATVDEKVIRAWWQKWPNANIGIPTGREFWALDVDPRHGGDQSLMQLVARHGRLADTIRQTTGGGGRQYLYLMPDQQTIGNAVGLWPGIDIRGVGGYIVVPPSIHPDTGKPYIWDTAKRSILEESLEPADFWLTSAILEASTGHQANGQPFKLPEKIKKGVQHKTLFQMGSAMRAKGCGYDEIFAALWELNQNRCEEPGPRANIEKLARSISTRYEQGSQNGHQTPPDEERQSTPLVSEPARKIYDSDYPEPTPVIEPVLYPGLTILGGRPKVGKSWFVLQLAIAVASGRQLASYLPVPHACSVLYVSLEDRPRQIRSRIRRLTPNEPYLENLNFVFSLDPLMSGGAATLDQHLAAHPVQVLIIDSLLAAVKQADRSRMDIMQADYNIVATLREIAEKHRLALVLVAHTRKAAGDFLDMVQGTSGTTAAADAIWVLQRMPEGDVILSVTGREVESNVFGLKREENQPAWMITGEGDAVTQSETRRDILLLLREEGPMKPSKIAQRLRKNISGTHRLLNALCELGLCARTAYGTYSNKETFPSKDPRLDDE